MKYTEAKSFWSEITTMITKKQYSNVLKRLVELAKENSDLKKKKQKASRVKSANTLKPL